MKDFQDRFIDAFCEALLIGNDRDLIVDYSKTMLSIAEKSWSLRHLGRKSAYPLERLQNNFRRLLQAAADSDKVVSKALFVKLLVDLYSRIVIRFVRYEHGSFTSQTPPSPQTSQLTSEATPTSGETADSAEEAGGTAVATEKAVEGGGEEERGADEFRIIDFYNVYDFFSNIICKIDIRTLSNAVRSMSEFEYSIQLTNLALFVDQSRDDRWYCDSDFAYLYRYLGQYLKKQILTPGINTEDYKNFTRNCLFDMERLGSPPIRADYKQELINLFYHENSIFLCGLIEAGIGNTVKDRLAFYLVENEYHSYDDIQELIILVAPFCCIYYFGFWEEEQYIDAEVRKQALYLAKELSGYYKSFLQKKKMLDFINGDLLSGSKLHTIMFRFDARMKRGHSIVIGDVVKDFYLFSIAMALQALKAHQDPQRPQSPQPAQEPCRHSQEGSRFFNWLNEYNLFNYLLYIKQDRKNKVQKLSKFIDFIGGVDIFTHLNPLDAPYCNNDLDVSNKLKAEKLFDRLIDGINARKEEIKIEIAEADKKYKARPRIEYTKKIKDKIIETLIENFHGRIIVEDDKEDGENDESKNTISYEDTFGILIESVHISLLLNGNFDEMCNNIADTVYTNLLQKYAEKIIHTTNVHRKNHLSFRSGLSYLKFIKYGNFKLMLGSRVELIPFLDYWDELEKVIKTSVCIMSDRVSYGIALKNDDLRFCMKNINVEIADDTVSNYKISSVENPFDTQEEFQDYVAKANKVIKVTAQIKIDIPANTSGFYFKLGRCYSKGT